MGKLLNFADEAAKLLALEYASRPEHEFVAWMNVALRREAMVAEAYDNKYLEGHLDRLTRTHGITEQTKIALRNALAGAWAQEASHRAYLDASCTKLPSRPRR